jgi:hypothetical protein
METAKNRDNWKKLVAARGKRDLFVISQGEGLNALPGTVIEGDAAGEAITFEKENGGQSTLPLTRGSFVGLVFNQPPRDVIPPTVCKLFDVFGNTLYAAKLDLPAAGLTVTTLTGATVAYPTTAGLLKLDFSRGNIAYLSDLDCTVSGPKDEPDNALTPFRKDTEGDKQPLKLADTAYAKGLLIPPGTTVTFKLKDDFRELKAIVGIPDSTANPSSTATLVVLADGRQIHAGTVTRKEKPKELVLDVKGVKELTIRVDTAELFTGNQVVLAEARLQK